MTDYEGNALDMAIAATGSVVSMRRFGTAINLTVIGPVATLDADQAELVGKSLLAASQLARVSHDEQQ